jgi:copper chaperone CopZ
MNPDSKISDHIHEGQLVRRKGTIAVGGAVVASIIASACCWLPLVFMGAGVSVGSAAALFESTRPIFLGIAFLLLTTGFYTVYVRKEACEPDSACEAPNLRMRKFNKITLWLATVGVILFAAFPFYVGIFTQEKLSNVDAAEFIDTTKLDFNVQGMTCEGCTAGIHNALMKVNGVVGVSVDYENALATVTLNNEGASNNELITAIRHSGFHATLIDMPSDELAEEN